jgi:glycosyltransferase involved in cell wall biosynthesis
MTNRPLDLEKRNFVLSVGSLTPLKGFDFLIRAMAELPEAGRPRLVIVSNFQNPPEKTYLEGLAGELHVELELLNNVSDQRLVELYNQAKMVLYAPVREPFGLVPLEAMACGTPVVGVCEGGVLETVLDGETGILVERDLQLFSYPEITLTLN